MTITSSFNKHTGTRYAYETTYEWDEGKQRKVQRRRCVGHFDPETGEVVPNGGRGRPRAEAAAGKAGEPAEPRAEGGADLALLAERVAALEAACLSLAAEARAMNERVAAAVSGRDS